MELSEITSAAGASALELLDKVRLEPGEILIVGCSTSEVAGFAPGTHSGPDIGSAILSGILPVCRERGVYLAAQCCEHLNRAVIIEAEALKAYGLERVNAVPQTHAGGSFAAALYNALESPAAVEHIRAHAGLDIGGVLIGMQLREVAVPVRLEARRIGEAIVLAARTRPKYIGGERALYDDRLR